MNFKSFFNVPNRSGKALWNVICSETFHVWHKLQDLVKINHKEIHALCCLDRTCSECGVDKLNLCAMEKDTSDSETITWRKYKYCETGKTNKKGQETKKNKLVDESSGLMWECSRDKNCPPIRCTNSKQIDNVSKWKTSPKSYHLDMFWWFMTILKISSANGKMRYNQITSAEMRSPFMSQFYTGL